MLRTAAEDLGLDLTRSILIGDKLSDLQAGTAAGCRVILVRTGYGREVEVNEDLEDVNLIRVVDTVADAVERCLAEIRI